MSRELERGEVAAIDYWLPKTEFIVTATRRLTVVTDRTGSRLEAVVDVSVIQSLAPDNRSAGRTLVLKAGLVESIDVSLDFADRGVITAVNSTSETNHKPILDLVGKAVTVLAGIAAGAATGGAGAAAAAGAAATLSLHSKDSQKPARPPRSSNLETKWATANEALAKHLCDLTGQSGRLLARMATEGEPSAAIVETGKALETVQAQITSILEARRVWMAAEECSETMTVRLPVDRLWRNGTLKSRLADEDVSLPEAQKALAMRIGCFLAADDPLRPVHAKTPPTEKPDHLSVRKPREASIGVYVRDEENGGWELRDGSVQVLDLVDDQCDEELLNLDNKTLAITFHPDGSFKTYGVKKARIFGDVAASITSTVDALAAAREKGVEAAKRVAEPKTNDTIKLELARSSQGSGAGHAVLAFIHTRETAAHGRAP